MVKTICNILSTIILVVLLAAAAVILVPMLLGYKEMAVLSGLSLIHILVRFESLWGKKWTL